MIKTLLLSSLVLCGCLHGQYRVTVAGSGNKQAFIAENPSSGVNGSCYDLRTVDPGTGILHDAGQMCGLFYATGYANAGVTIETVTGDSVFQPNTTFRGPGMIVGATGPSSYIPTAGPYAAVISPSNPAYLVVEGTTGAAAIILRDGVGPTNSKMWDFIADAGGNLHFRAVNDIYGAAQDFLTISRSGLTINSATFNESLLFGGDNSYNVGSSTSAAVNVYTAGVQLGRGNARQGSATFFNPLNGNSFVMAGTNVATGGGDLVVGNLFGSGAIYPINSSTNLGYASGPFANAFVTNLTIYGTCTGCSGAAGANTALSNLASTAINTTLNTTSDIYVKTANVHVQTSGGVDLIELQYSTGTAGALLFNNSSGTNLVQFNQFGVDVANGATYNYGGLTGETHTVTTGTCTMNFSGGILTSTSGC